MPPHDTPPASDCSNLPPAARQRVLREEAARARAGATAAQHKAADPAVSVFVNAHAGSGKTYLLVNRVIRLLLDGTRPENILCITYTRAAAAEMRTRLFDRLAEWIHLDDGDLLQRIHRQLDHRHFPRCQLPRARRLFAAALETPGGLRVQTIHAFCERLLQAFPVEAGLPPGFTVMDEAETRALLQEARLRLLAGEDDEVRDDLALLATHLSEQDLQDHLAALLTHRRLLARMHLDRQFEAFVLDALRQLLDVGKDTPADPERWQTTWMQLLGEMPLHQWITRLASVIESNGRKTDRDTLAALHQLHAAMQDGNVQRAWQASRKRLLTIDGAPRKQLFTKAVVAAAPDITAHVQALGRRFAQHHDGLLARRILRANVALLHVGRRVLGLYEEAKARLGKFDYDDLVLRTLQLLDGPEGQWVLYRLDARIDHILLDEAQDTSPEQWRILQALCEEFTAGEGVQRPAARTLFAVGDVKQSIYSFQGAAPQAFHHMRQFFRQRFTDAGLAFESVPLRVSFRTVKPILQVVDAVLEQPDFHLGEERDTIQPHHSARPHVPGFVELWPLERPDEDEEDEEQEEEQESGAKGKASGNASLRRALDRLWTPPQSLQAGLHPRLKLAARIADTIRRWLDDGEALPPDPDQSSHAAQARGTPPPRPIRPRDILILVRNRTTLMEAIVSALKQRGIPVAGVDRLRVADHIAVQDMLALARFLLLPADDLSLAAVLKSPLLSRDDGHPFDDDDLLRLRGEQFDFGQPLEAITTVRDDRPLWRQLRTAATRGAPVREAVRRLQRWRRLAGHLPAYELLAHVLWRDGGLRRFMQRLGSEVLEPLEALLDLALQFERDHTASLGAFVEWLHGESPEIKREQEGDADLPEDAPGAVRVMTVHGAKGLEAPVVFLADTTSVPDRRKIRLVEAPIADAGEELPLWPMKADGQPQVVRELVQRHIARQEEEYNRLLYVAMTRAADRLYVCGAADARSRGADDDGQRKQPRIRSWYERIAAVLQRDELAVRLDDGRTGWRFPDAAPRCRHAVRATGESVALPTWVRQPPPPEPGPAAWLSPSRLPSPGSDETATPPARDEPVLSPLSLARRRHEPQRDPFRRGVLIHKLLQYLPHTPPRERARHAMQWLTRPASGLTAEQAQELWAEVEKVLQQPELSALFGPHARAEVPFALHLTGSDGRELFISGQIDRLAVLDEEVIVADFKTARPVPASVEEVPESYVRQLALYRLAASRLWPQGPVRGVLIYTAGPTLLELPPDMLEAALSQFGQHG